MAKESQREPFSNTRIYTRLRRYAADRIRFLHRMLRASSGHPALQNSRFNACLLVVKIVIACVGRCMRVMKRIHVNLNGDNGYT